ncbi:MAG TPA: PEGA domain-containing protein [Myxococcales bacterium]|nr:PEGA domain-containing protein [Myxococcales bacterium]
MALYPLQPLGVPAETVASLDETLRAEIGGLRFQLLPRGRTVAAIRSVPGNLGIACNGGAACLADLGRLLTVDKIVYGVVSGLGDRFSFDLKLVDVASDGEERRVAATIDGKRDALLPGLREAAVHLLAPQRWTGALELRATVDDAVVSVDGKTLGKTPLRGPIAGLAPGQHSLRLSRPGYSDFEKIVTVRFDQTTVVEVDVGQAAVRGVMYRKGAPLAPVGRRGTPVVVVTEEGEGRATDPRRVWAWGTVWTTVGLAAVGLGAGIASQLERNAASGTLRPVATGQAGTLAQQISLGEGFGAAADVAWSLAGAGIVTAGILFAVSASHAPSSVTVAPTAGGLSISGRW